MYDKKNVIFHLNIIQFYLNCTFKLSEEVLEYVYPTYFNFNKKTVI